MNESSAVTNDRQELRFQFGENWGRFLEHVSESRIVTATESLRRLLRVPGLQGKSFLDVGSGSGLFSLAARRLGARVHSFDYDAASVACTQELKRRYRLDDPDWTIERGSVLDSNYLRGLGTFDVVYSWGVLHHTGAMWQALENVAPSVAPNGMLYIAIYNDQGSLSKWWTQVKRTYNALPRPLRLPFATAVMGPRELLMFCLYLSRGRPLHYIRSFTDYSMRSGRGMSRWHDLIDWVGGYPFEVAKPEEVFDFYRQRGFRLEAMTTCQGKQGCNEFVFGRDTAVAKPSRARISAQR